MNEYYNAGMEKRWTNWDVAADTLLVFGTIGTKVIDGVNNIKPHLFDRVNPAIESHFGNVPDSLWIAILPLFLWHYAARSIMADVKSDRWIRAADVVVPILVVGLAVLANLAAEIWDVFHDPPPNYEFGNDLAWGVAAAGVVGMRFLLPALARRVRGSDKQVLDGRPGMGDT